MDPSVGCANRLEKDNGSSILGKTFVEKVDTVGEMDIEEVSRLKKEPDAW